MAGKNIISRRSFLKKGSCVTAGAMVFPYFVPASVLGKAGNVAPSNRIVMGCIGMGGQGTFDMKQFLQYDDAQVVAVCDVNKESGGYLGSAWGGWKQGIAGWAPAKRFVEEHYGKQKSSGKYKGCAAYTDFRELLARDDIDGVLIATPDYWHALMSVAGAEAGKDIYCEKPLAYSIAEGRAVCDAVERYGRIFQTGAQRRSSSKSRFACELVRNGRIGKLQRAIVSLPAGYMINGSYEGIQRPMPIPKDFDYDMWLGPAPWAPYTEGRCLFNFRWIRDYTPGFITDWGAHSMDLAQWANGSDATGPVEIEGHGEFPKNGLYNTATSHYVELTFADGVKFVSQTTTDVATGNDDDWGLRFEGTDGWFWAGAIGSARFGKTHSKSLLREVIGPDEINLYRSPGHHRNFLDSVKTRKETVSPAEVGQRTATVCHLGHIAILTGRKLKWDPEKEEFINDAEANRLLSRPMRKPWHL